MQSEATIIPSEESKKLAAKLLEGCAKDRVIEATMHNAKHTVDFVALGARIAAALEQSWQQGLEDAEVFRRVAMLRGAK